VRSVSRWSSARRGSKARGRAVEARERTHRVAALISSGSEVGSVLSACGVAAEWWAGRAASSVMALVGVVAAGGRQAGRCKEKSGLDGEAGVREAGRSAFDFARVCHRGTISEQDMGSP
jgi:hypothetical protein